MSCEGCTKEKQAVGKGAETVALLNEAVKQRDGVIKLLAVVLVGVVLAFMVMAGCMVWAVQNAQNVANEAMLNALNAVAEMEATTTETTTTEVTQDTGEGGGNNIYQQEGGTYNESGVE